MSNFLPSQLPTTPVQDATSVVGPVSAQDRQLIGRVFKDPNLIPESFWSFAVDYLAVNQPQIPISQIAGFAAFNAILSYTASEQTTVATSFTDLGGPSLTNVPDGKYVLIFGCVALVSVNVQAAVMVIQIDGVNQTETVQIGDNTSGASLMTATTKTLSAGGAGGHTVKAMYRSSSASSTARFSERFLLAFKYGNL